MRRGIRIVICSFMLVLLLAPAHDAFAAAEKKRVLVLYAEGKDLPAHELVDQGIRSAVKSSQTFAVDLFVEYLNLSRFKGPPYQEILARFLGDKYAGKRPDLIITVSAPALDFVMNYGHDLFPGTPVVACTVFEYQLRALEQADLRRRVTGVAFTVALDDIIKVARTLKPGARRIAIVAGASESDQLYLTHFRHALRQYEPEIEVMELVGLPMPELLERVRTLPPQSLVLYSTVFVDGTGQPFLPRDALSMVARAANAPVFGGWDSYLGYGIVGGHLLSLEAEGKKAMELGFRIISGVSPADIPITGEGTHATLFDWRELHRWGISEQALPPGSIVKFKPPSIWHDHWQSILAGILLISIETFLIIGLVVNLQRRKRAEAGIAASELRYRTVADYTYDWEYWAAPDGTLNYISPSCERISGYSVQEFLDDPSLISRIIVPEDKEIWDKHFHDDWVELKEQEIQFRIRTRSGETRWIDHACQPVRDSEGKPLGLRASNRDVTDRKKAELEAQHHRNELAHVARVTSMGEIGSSLAHEINQPLTAIRNYAYAARRFLSHEIPNVNVMREALDGIIQDGQRAAQVIQRIRNLAKKERPQYGVVDLRNVIQETLAFLRNELLMKRLSIESEFAPGLPAVLGDRIQLQQVLLNLILNAVDAMNGAEPDFRKLVIMTENHEDRGVKVSVRDFGIGIDKAHMDKLFEPFYTTKSEGTGMGLAICAGIIQAHRGSIWAENNPDRGATFYFTLPTAARDE